MMPLGACHRSKFILFLRKKRFFITGYINFLPQETSQHAQKTIQQKEIQPWKIQITEI
jgi:hypothetical protein